MMDFGNNEIYLRAIISQRNKEAESAYRLAEYRPAPRGLRATLASRLAHLAVHLDGETTDKLVVNHLKAAGRHG
jgi:hypothetical protein